MPPSESSSPEPESDFEVRLLPILAALGAFALVSVGVFTLMDPASTTGEAGVFFRGVGLALILLGGALLVAAVGLWLRRTWSWWLSVGIDVAYVVLLIVVHAVHPFRDPSWLVAPTFAAVILLWLYLVRRDFGVDLAATASPPPA